MDHQLGLYIKKPADCKKVFVVKTKKPLTTGSYCKMLRDHLDVGNFLRFLTHTLSWPLPVFTTIPPIKCRRLKWMSLRVCVKCISFWFSWLREFREQLWFFVTGFDAIKCKIKIQNWTEAVQNASLLSAIQLVSRGKKNNSSHNHSIEPSSKPTFFNKPER